MTKGPVMANANSTCAPAARELRLNLEKEIAELRRMTVNELADRYAELFGEQTRTRHKQYLLRKIAWRIQSNAEGDLSVRARRRAAELANDADVRVTPPRNSNAIPTNVTPVEHPVTLSDDPRIPSVGTAITRKYKGRKIQVIVLEDGFDFDGERYKSLSAVAKAITGTHCNGFRFFKLEAPQ